MAIKKRTILSAVVVAALVLGAALWVALRSRGDQRLDEWIGRQLVGITNAYLVPQLDFGTLRYESPLTVRLTDVVLVAPDRTRVLDIPGLVIALAEIPRPGQPLRIARVEIAGGRVNLTRIPPANGRPAGFKGLSPFVKGQGGRGEVDPNYRLSNVLRLERVTLRDCAVRFDPGDGSGVMELAGLALDMGVSRAEGYAEQGWYAIRLDSGRAPGAVIHVDGAVNIDSMAADLKTTTLSIDVSPETIGTLPPALQDLLRTYDASGRLALSAGGRLETDDLAASTLDATLELTGFNIGVGDFRFPIDRATARAGLSGGVLDIPEFNVEAIDGTLAATGSVNLQADGMPARVRWRGDRLDLQRLLRAQSPEGNPPKLAGRLRAEGEASADVATAPGSLSGSGIVQVRDGRLVMLPGLTELADLLNVGPKLLGATGLTHRADAEFDLTGAGVRVKSSTVETEFVAARATGLVAYDGTLDLDVNAGPLEKLQSNLGKVGEIFGKLTDKLVTYHVTGPMADPSVKVAPLGIK